MATVHGFTLRRQRYGAESRRLMMESVDRERWPIERWREWRAARLKYVLTRAATQVPYYREHWEERRRLGDHASWEVLANWPLLEKSVLRQHPRRFLADDCRRRPLIPEHTSGTTGTPLNLWRSRETIQTLYALSEVRERRWYGVSVRQPWAILGGQVVAPVHQQRPPFWVWNAALNQLYMSSYHLQPALIPYYLDALRDHRVSYVLGYTSSLYALALEALRSGRTDLRMNVVITNAEPVTERQRQVIAEAFQCPVRETYGMAEMALFASECEQGTLHMWPEVGWLEVLDDGGVPVEPGMAGEFVVTGLMNADMPLIRYRVGDRGAQSAAATCACGRTLPQLHSVEGRTDDVLYAADGRRIGRLDPVFKADLPLREAQIIQESLHRIRVRYVPADGFSPRDGRAIIDRLKDRMGPIDVVLESVPEIPRGANGKFRAVISHVSTDSVEKVELTVST